MTEDEITWWMATPTQWTWVWVNSWSWWWTGRPGVLQSMGSQRVGHDWACELNWTVGWIKWAQSYRGMLGVRYFSDMFWVIDVKNIFLYTKWLTVKLCYRCKNTQVFNTGSWFQKCLYVNYISLFFCLKSHCHNLWMLTILIILILGWLILFYYNLWLDVYKIYYGDFKELFSFYYKVLRDSYVFLMSKIVVKFNWENSIRKIYCIFFLSTQRKEHISTYRENKIFHNMQFLNKIF